MTLVLGRFEVEDQPFASGGFGSVFRGTEQATGKKVAIKTFYIEADDTREIDILRHLKHPSIPALLGAGMWNGERCHVTEYVDGPSLAQMMVKRKAPFTPKEAAGYIVDVCKALYAAHAPHPYAVDGVVHRDVSPHNIIVDSKGHAHLIDFGVAKIDSTVDPIGVLVGKVAYMSPEQASASNVNGAADQFCAGIVLWEMLMGCRLFRADSDAATWRNVLACNIPEYPEGALGKVLKKMLAPERSRRYLTCLHAANALAEAVEKM